MKTNDQFVYLLLIRDDQFFALKGPNGTFCFPGGYSSKPTAKEALSPVLEVFGVNDTRFLIRRVDHKKRYIHFYIARIEQSFPKVNGSWFPLSAPPKLVSKGWSHDQLLTDALHYARSVLDVVLRPKRVTEKKSVVDPLEGVTAEVKEKSKAVLKTAPGSYFHYGRKRTQRNNFN